MMINNLLHSSEMPALASYLASIGPPFVCFLGFAAFVLYFERHVRNRRSSTDPNKAGSSRPQTSPLLQSVKSKFYHTATNSSNTSEHHNDLKNSSKNQKAGDPGVVKVFILLGQSNMLGMGHIAPDDKDGSLEYAVKNKGLYQYLVEQCENVGVETQGKDKDDDNDDIHWAHSDRVRNVAVISGHGRDGMNVYHNEFMTVRGDRIGPEFGIGHYLEDGLDGPVMILKSCIGNRSLGWDLLPPGSKRCDYGDFTYAGYGDGTAKWPKGTEPDPPKPDAWYAGKQYDDDIAHAKVVLSDLDTFYPEATKYEVAGFFWWQGDKDRYDEGHSAMYEKNLIHLIAQLRADFEAPYAKFVLATLGQDDIDNCTGNDKLLLDAMMAVDGKSGKYLDNVGNVSTVYSHPLSKGGASNSHYGGNAETYMDIGEAMGQAMLELVASTPPSPTNDDENGEEIV